MVHLHRSSFCTNFSLIKTYYYSFNSTNLSNIISIYMGRKSKHFFENFFKPSFPNIIIIGIIQMPSILPFYFKILYSNIIALLFQECYWILLPILICWLVELLLSYQWNSFSNYSQMIPNLPAKNYTIGETKNFPTCQFLLTICTFLVTCWKYFIIPIPNFQSQFIRKFKVKW